MEVDGDGNVFNYKGCRPIIKAAAQASNKSAKVRSGQYIGASAYYSLWAELPISKSVFRPLWLFMDKKWGQSYDLLVALKMSSHEEEPSRTLGGSLIF